jgi:hypothetical protein
MRSVWISDEKSTKSVDGSAERRHSPFMVTLYRAANDGYLNPDTTSFGEQRETAEAYLGNPGFGGSVLWSVDVEVDADKVLDITGGDMPGWLARIIDGMGSISPDVALSYAAVHGAVAERGYEWIRHDLETHPVGAIVWVRLGSDSAIEDAMTEVA